MAIPWSVCLVTDTRGSSLIYETLGDVPESVVRLRKWPLCRLLAAVVEFANGGAVFTTIASVPISAWRSANYIVSILNSGADSVLPKMITDRLEALPMQKSTDRTDDYTVHSAIAESAADAETIPELREFAKTVVIPLVTTYLGRNLLEVFAIDSVIQCEWVGGGFPARLYNLDEIEPKKRTVVARSNTDLWGRITSTTEEVTTISASDTITVVVCKQSNGSALVIFTTVPIRRDQIGIRALTPDLQSAIAEWTRIQTTSPSEPGPALAPRPPAAAFPANRPSRDFRTGPDRASIPIRRHSVGDVAPGFLPSTTTPGQITTNKKP